MVEWLSGVITLAGLILTKSIEKSPLEPLEENGDGQRHV